MNTGRTRFKKGQSSWNKGLKKSGMSGKKHPEIWKEKMRERFLGKKRPDLAKENHWNWQGGKSDNRDIHSLNNPDYRKWRMEVFERDNFTCKLKDDTCHEKIQAHHILPWRDYKELRFIINNGITLCQAHHPRKRSEEKRLEPLFMELVSVSKD